MVQYGLIRTLIKQFYYELLAFHRLTHFTIIQIKKKTKFKKIFVQWLMILN